MMNIRRAQERDIPRLGELLLQVCRVHHQGRPDLFREVGRKYTDAELQSLLQDDERPILVAVDEADRVLGYAFCILLSTLYLDDLCVDESCRGQRIGNLLYEGVVSLARELGCYNVTLNVWACNGSALRFYERCGLKPLKIGMEQIL